jgi:hypothetical protein
MIFQTTASAEEERLEHLLACFANKQETEASRGQQKPIFLLSYTLMFFKVSTSVLILQYAENEYRKCANQKQHQLLFQKVE